MRSPERFSSFIFMVNFFGSSANWWFNAPTLESKSSPFFLSDSPGTRFGRAQAAPVICRLIPDLPRRQRRLCQMHPDSVAAVWDGARLALAQCQRQFINHRWNCSTVQHNGRILMKEGSRESSFVYAIHSAGAIHSIAKACARGEIGDCSCDNVFLRQRDGRTSRDEKGFFQWGGCSDNVRYASRFGRQVTDWIDKKANDPQSLVNRHNVRVGRKIVKYSLHIQCKCHGVSGSCAVRTCWKSLPQFDYIALKLRKKYEKALQVNVESSSSGGITLVPLQANNDNSNAFIYDNDQNRDDFSLSRHNIETPSLPSFNTYKWASLRRATVTDDQLVFLDLSPDYCTSDVKSGSLGTHGRKCNRTSTGTDSCDVMCCGRGYDTKQEKKIFKCNCKFIWCCKVECQSCMALVETYTCKHYDESSSSSSSSKRKKEIHFKQISKLQSR